MELGAGEQELEAQISNWYFFFFFALNRAEFKIHRSHIDKNNSSVKRKIFKLTGNLRSK